jgi:hypothetical protein
MPRAGLILASLEDLPWKVVRVHLTRRGGVIVTALNGGRIAAVELPAQSPDEAQRAWIARVDRLLEQSAYDPTDASPSVLLLALPNDFAELVPDTGFELSCARFEGSKSRR